LARAEAKDDPELRQTNRRRGFGNIDAMTLAVETAEVKRFGTPEILRFTVPSSAR
jgi:hypothetical protein